MLAEAEARDASEDHQSAARYDDQLPGDLSCPTDRLARLRRCHDKLQRRAAAAAAGQQEKLDARAAAEQAKGKRQRGRKPKPPDAAVEPDTVANVSDPDSGIMKTRRGWVQGYNAQVVVTPEQIILAADLTTQANDVRQLTPMLDQALANVETVMGEEAVLGAAVADAGYWSEANAEAATEECELFIATQKDHKQRAALRQLWTPALSTICATSWSIRLMVRIWPRSTSSGVVISGSALSTKRARHLDFSLTRNSARSPMTPRRRRL